MSDESDLEKSEPASARKREKAREEGQVPRSRELDTCLSLGAAVLGLWVFGSQIGRQLQDLLQTSLLVLPQSALGPDAGPLSVLQAMVDPLLALLLACAPLFLLVMASALVSPMVMGGFLFSAQGFAPDFSRLSPAKGLGRMLSSHALMELIKAVLKASLIGLVSVVVVSGLLAEALQLSALDLRQAVPEHGQLLLMGISLVALVLLVIALLDGPYQLWDYEQKLRMSKQELKQEHKESEGSPEIKAKIRSQQRAMARNRMMSKVPKADVVVTNPTHFAVALRYEDTGARAAPRVVAKGSDALAARIRELAREHQVPVVEAPPLARALFRHVELDREVPTALYAAVAQVLAYVYQLKAPGLQRSVPQLPSDLQVPPELDLPLKAEVQP